MEVPIAFMFMAALCAVLLVAVFALARERRLRLGLQAILNRILAQWRQHAKDHSGHRRGRRRSRQRGMRRGRNQTTGRNGRTES